MSVLAGDTRIYLSVDTGDIYAWDFTTSDLQRMARTGLALRDIAVAPDGTLFAITATDLYRIDTDTASATRIGPLTSDQDLYFGVRALNDAAGFDISPQGIARISSRDNALVVNVDLSTGQVSNLVGPVLGSADGGHDLWYSSDNNYRVTTGSYNIKTIAAVIGGGELETSSAFTSNNALDGLTTAPVAARGVSAGTWLGFSGTGVYDLSRPALPGLELATLSVGGAITGATRLRDGQGAGSPPAATPGDLIEFQPDDGKDSYTGSVYPSRDAEFLLVGGWGDYYHAFLEFDLGTLPRDIDSATLRLYVRELPTGRWSFPEMALYRLTGDWAEGLDWSDPQPEATFVRNIGKPDGVGWFEIDITDLYRGWQDGSFANNGLQLRPLTNFANAVYFYSSEFADSELRPMLLIDPAEGGGIPSPELVGSIALSGADENGWVAVPGNPDARRYDNPKDLYIIQNEARVLRLDGGSIIIDGSRIAVTNAAVYDGFGHIAAPLFTGNFTLDGTETGAVTATGFTETAPSAYALDADFAFSDMAEVTFRGLTLENGVARLAGDLSFARFLSLATTGSNYALTLSADGAQSGLGTLTSGRLYTADLLNFDVTALGHRFAITFDEIGLAQNFAEDAVYAFGSGSVTTRIAGTDWTLGLDFAGAPDGDTLLPGLQFIRHDIQDGWDIVGSLSVQRQETKLMPWLTRMFPEPSAGIENFTLDLDTILQTATANAEIRLPASDARINLGATLGWDPLRVDGVSLGLSGANIQVASTPLFLTGGSLSAAGFFGDPGFTLSGTVNGSLGPSNISILRGSATGSLAPDRVSLNGQFDAKAEYLLDSSTVADLRAGGTSTNPLVRTLDRVFGLDPEDVLGWSFASFGGDLSWDWTRKGLEIEAEASFLGGALTGVADFVYDVGNDWSLSMQAAARLPNLPAFGLLRGATLANVNLFASYTHDDTRANDYLAAWTKIGPITAGIRLGMDGSFERLGAEEIALIGSWRLSPDMDWATMTAHWDNPSDQAELVVITPDGTRLGEADIAARADMEILSGLASAHARTVVVHNPIEGIWDIEVTSPDDLGTVVYEASQDLTSGTLELGGVQVDRARGTASIDYSTTVPGMDGSLRLFVDRDGTGANGVEITESPLNAATGSGSFVWNFAGFAPGRFHVYGVLETSGAPVVIDYAEGQIDVAFAARREYLGTDGADRLFSETGGAFDTAAGQVYRLYKATLDRTPDRAGHLDWTGRLLDGAALSKVADGFIGSPEFVQRFAADTNTEFVSLLYANVLNRLPDTDGLAHWTRLLDTDARSRADVVLGFSESPEFQRSTAPAALDYSRAAYQSDLGDDVFRLYRATLDRVPDLAGFMDWSGRLAEGMGYDAVVSGFLNAPEFLNTYGALDGQEFVTLLYQTVLNRAPDSAGLVDWASRLDGGATRASIVKGFAQSPEFQTRTAAEFRQWMHDQEIDDYLDGGAGHDILFGGVLSDVFRFSREDGGLDRIVGFEPWDRIALLGYDFETPSVARAAFVQDGADLVLRVGADEIRLANVQPADLPDEAILLL